jgi:hypothetical protein
MTKQRMALISLIGILVFGLLLGGQLVYKNKWVNGALAQESQEIQGIISAQVISYDGLSELQVKTTEIDNLQKVSTQLQKIAGKHPIRFVDQRTAELERLFQKMQFPLQEGIVRGNFTQMEQVIRELANQSGVELSLTMDSEAIYLTLNKEKSQLVSVIERHGQGKFLTSEGL